MLDILKQSIANLARKLGYTIIPTWQLSEFAAVEDLRRRFATFEIDLVLDVGANEGQYRDLLRQRVGYTGQIVSFEPIPHLARSLADRAVADPRWTVFNQALGAEVGTVNFNVMADFQFSSFLIPRHDDVSLFTGANKVTERILVEVSTLDAILPPLLERHSPRGIFLKLDTQGYDLEVLKGGTTFSLPQIVALQTEASVRPIYDRAPGYQETLSFLDDHGFVMSGIFPNNAGHFPLLVEFDCHMVQAARLPNAKATTKFTSLV
jgi:FkbM family methyltransferase